MAEPATSIAACASLQKLRVALAGNPNCGKSSIFNALTGAKQHVGNYPGVTVERWSGSCELGGQHADVIDLPGTYSLSSYTPEERVAQDELAGQLDVVVVVADSTQLSRNLVLLAQVMQTGAKLVLCLNMADEARAAGQRLDLRQMERLLGFPVVETVGHRRQGLGELRAAIERAAGAPAARHRLVLGADLEAAIDAIRRRLPDSPGSEWAAVRLLVDDEHYLRRTARQPGGERAIDEARRQRAQLEQTAGRDISLFVTERYFGFVDGLLREVRTSAPRLDARLLSDRLDNLLVHPLLGLPLFAMMMYGIFWLTFRVGEYPAAWLESAVTALGASVSSLWPEASDAPLRSLVVDGVIAGVGGVVVFVPNIALLFLGLGLLEDTGYMARAAFLTDRLMHRFGLHGKSFIPMLTGFGCSVPGIMATRTLENERDRLVTMLVLPLMSCGARFPIWMLLVPAFFPPAWRAPVLWMVYVAGVALALLLSLLLRKTLMRGDDAPFVMELPPYRLPTVQSVLIKLTQRAGLYLRKAATVILGISVLLWLATAYPKPSSYRVDAESALAPMAAHELAARRAAEDLEYSVAGRAGRLLAPAFEPLGFDWKIVTAMIGAFAAKELFVAQMGIVYSLADADADTGTAGLRTLLARDYPPLAGVSLILFLLVGTPCVATVAVTRRESGRWRWALLQFGVLTTVAYVLALVVYQLGRLAA